MGIGIWQLLLILVIVFVVFGAGKLPRVMGDIGKGVKSLKQGLKDGEQSPEDESMKVVNSENNEKEKEKQKTDTDH